MFLRDQFHIQYHNLLNGYYFPRYITLTKGKR